MNGAQFLLISLITILYIVTSGKLSEAKEEDDGNFRENLAHRITKRYTMGRVPLSYVRNLENEQNLSADKRYRSNSILNNPPASHFREVQVRQTRRPPPPSEADLSPGQLQSYRNLLQYYGSGNNPNEIDPEGMDSESQIQIGSSQFGGDTQLTDRELKALLYLLEGYQAMSNSEDNNPNPNSRSMYQPYEQEMMIDDPRRNPLLGKRETGKRTDQMGKLNLGQEQPMSFENSLGDNYPVFLNQKRSKRIGFPVLRKRSSGGSDVASLRIKETDPKIEESLDKIFEGSSITAEQDEGHHQHTQHSTLIPTTAISSSDQIPAPSSNLQNKMKAKKAINWSKHFGIDKRSGGTGVVQEEHKPIETSSYNPGSIHNNNNNNDNIQHENKMITTSASTSSSSSSEGPSSSSSSSPKHVAEKKEDKLDKAKLKETKSRQENESEDKEREDRKWILKEFYKNLAMSTNVKRKRESPAKGDEDLNKLEKMEKKMAEAGDQIIWDALKYTGAHRDVQLSPEELAHVKTEIIQKLAAAYSLEKIREAIEEFRQQLGQLKDKQQQYY